MHRHHLVYVTANDQRNFSIDYLNFRNMAVRHPGVDQVEITMVISCVRPWSHGDGREISALARRIAPVPWLKLRKIILKGNVGRDFSSTEAGLRSLADEVADDDFVMVRNRSAYGPFGRNWYKSFMDLYRRHPGTGMVGNTINLMGPAALASCEDGRHVQTYVYLSCWKNLASLIDNYPGNRCSDNASAIRDGELGLSRKLLASAQGISCLCWPDHLFGATTADDPSLPRRDIKSDVFGLPFRYKYPAYRRDFKALLTRTAWVVGARWMFRLRSGGANLFRQVAGYD